MVQYGGSSRSSRAKSVRSSTGRTIFGKAIRESSIRTRLGQSSKLGMLFRKPRKHFSCLCMWTIFKLAGKKQNIAPMWKVLMKEVDLGEPTSFLDHVYLGCTQRECQTSKDIVDNYRNMFEYKISAGAQETLPYSEKLGANISSWSCDLEGHAKKGVERYCELANRTTLQFYKDQLKEEEEMGSVGELSIACSQFVLKCLYLARIGRPDILWSVNKLARAVTK